MALLVVTFLMGCTGTIPKLGIKTEQLTPCPNSPNCVVSQISDKEHFILPILFSGTQQDAQQRLLKILENFAHTNIVSVRENYIRVEFRTKVFGFVDDAEFYFSQTENNKITINVRSASRIGYSDFGVNRKRIEQIRNIFKDDVKI
jgi:uncharacterized protein (DUF1499 family)